MNFGANESVEADTVVDCGQPCGLDCAWAQTLRSDPFADEWLWCVHPANSTRLVHTGRMCARHQPASRTVEPSPSLF